MKKQNLKTTKIKFSILFLLASATVMAQSLEQKIPTSASLVVTFDAKNVLELVPEKEWNQSAIFQELFKKLKQDGKDVQALRDMGIDIDAKVYYAMDATDSISFHNFYLPLTDRKKMEALFDERDVEQFVREGDKTTFRERSMSATWNDGYMILTGGLDSYTYMNEHKKRLLKGKDEDQWWTTKRAVIEKWMEDYTNRLFDGGYTSIISNKRYQASKDKNAVMSIWVNDYGNLLGDAYKEISKELPYLFINKNSNYGIENMAGHWYFDKDNTRMKLDITYDSTLARSMKRIYRNRMNRKLYSYVDIDNAIGYMGMSFDTENAMTEYPEIVKHIYGKMLPDFKEEMGIITDLYSIIFDEKEIADLFPGNGLLVFTDLREKDVEYTTYEYDENYKQKEITKTKKDLRPDLILLIETKKDDFFKKALKLAGKYKFAEVTDNLFQIKIPEYDGSDIFAYVNDGVVAIATDKKDLVRLVSRTKFNIGRDHRRFFRKHPFSLHLNTDILAGKLETKINSSKDKKMFGEFVDTYDGLSMHYSRIKGNDLTMEIQVDTDSGQENSMKAFLDFMNELFLTYR